MNHFLASEWKRGMAQKRRAGHVEDVFLDGPVQIVRSVAQRRKILVGGAFTPIGGQSRFKFARLSNDTAAHQNLAVTQANITGTLGGLTSHAVRAILALCNVATF